MPKNPLLKRGGAFGCVGNWVFWGVSRGVCVGACVCGLGSGFGNPGFGDSGFGGTSCESGADSVRGVCGVCASCVGVCCVL